MKVLLAPDSSRVNEVFSVRLVAEGIEPYQVLDDDDLLMILDEKPIDILVLDLDSENYRGLKTVKEVKTRFNQVDIILMTSKTGMDFAKNLAEMGVYGFVSRTTQLEAMVNQALGLIEEMRGRKQEQRKHMRVKPAPFQVNAFKLRIPGLQTSNDGIIRDISLGGVAVDMDHEVNEAILFEGQEVDVSFELGNLVLDARALVVARKGKSVAYRFKDLSESDKRKIAEYVIDRMG